VRRRRKTTATAAEILAEHHPYPGAYHVFNQPSEKPRDFLGHHLVYDEKATQDAHQRADAFIAALMK
jgi:dienelactone hydrolase